MNNNQINNKSIFPTVENLIKLLSSKSEVEGVVLMGGFSKGRFTDEYSDIDLCVFLGSKAKWLPKFEFNIQIQQGNVHINKIDVNMYQFQVEKELIANWEGNKKYAFQTCELMYDKSGKIKRLIEEKTQFTTEDVDKLRYNATKIQLYLELTPTTQAKRGHILLAHQIFNTGIDILLNTLFLLNKKPVPHDKWKFFVAESLPWKPKNLEAKLKEAIVIKDDTLNVLKRRIDLFKPVLDEVCDKIEEFFGKSITDIYEDACNNILERQLNEVSFSDAFLKEYCEALPLKEKKIVEGFINYHLVDSVANLRKIITSGTYNKHVTGSHECLSVLND